MLVVVVAVVRGLAREALRTPADWTLDAVQSTKNPSSECSHNQLFSEGKGVEGKSLALGFSRRGSLYGGRNGAGAGGLAPHVGVAGLTASRVLWNSMKGIRGTWTV